MGTFSISSSRDTTNDSLKLELGPRNREQGKVSFALFAIPGREYSATMAMTYTGIFLFLWQTETMRFQQIVFSWQGNATKNSLLKREGNGKLIAMYAVRLVLELANFRGKFDEDAG